MEVSSSAVKKVEFLFNMHTGLLCKMWRCLTEIVNLKKSGHFNIQCLIQQISKCMNFHSFIVEKKKKITLIAGVIIILLEWCGKVSRISRAWEKYKG